MQTEQPSQELRSSAERVHDSAQAGARIRAIASWYAHHPSTPTPASWELIFEQQQ